MAIAKIRLTTAGSGKVCTSAKPAMALMTKQIFIPSMELTMAIACKSEVLELLLSMQKKALQRDSRLSMVHAMAKHFKQEFMVESNGPFMPD